MRADEEGRAGAGLVCDFGAGGPSREAWGTTARPVGGAREHPGPG